MKLFFLVVCTECDTREDAEGTAATTKAKLFEIIPFQVLPLLSIDSLCIHGFSVLLMPSSSYS